jgi:hypothetical protein
MNLIYFSIFVLLLLTLNALVQSNPITSDKTQQSEATKYTFFTQRSDPTKRTGATKKTDATKYTFFTQRSDPTKRTEDSRTTIKKN